MNTSTVSCRRLAAILLNAAVVWLATIAGAAWADPPAQAGRLALAQGPVSYAPGGDDAWIEAQLNRPLTVGDRLWAGDNGRAEIELPGASVRMSELTSVSLLNLDDRIVQLQVAQGRVNVRVRTLPQGETFEIDTPNAAFVIDRVGDYRIDVDAQAGATTIALRDGTGSVYGDGASFALRRGETVRVYGTDLARPEFYALAPADNFDRWSRERDRRFASSYAARYVSPEIVGYADLDTYGTWRPAESFGNVWFPRDVPQGWAPYRYGHWSWIDPWGWTWVDDAPWGFAPFHYGRWAYVAGSWGWVPGPVRVRPVYAPALVAFVGGADFQIAFRSGPSAGGIGWFPLAPGEAYRPAYVASRDYVRNVNVSNTIINTTVINNIYQNNVTQVNYRNAQVANAVTAVPPTVFAQAQPVQRNAVTVSRDVVMRGQITPTAAVAPTRVGITGAAATTNNRPAPEVLQRSVVARSAPPAPVVPVAQRVEMLQREPGKPLDRPAIAAREGAATAAPNVHVVSKATPQTPPRVREGAQNAAPPPPATAPSQAAREQRGSPPGAAQPDERVRANTQIPPATPAAPMAVPRAMPPSSASPSSAAAQPPASPPQLRRDQRNADNGQRPANTVAPAPPQAATPPVAPARVAQPQPAPAAPPPSVARTPAAAPPAPAATAPAAAIDPRRANEGNAPPMRQREPRQATPAPQAAPAAPNVPPPQARGAPSPQPQPIPQARVAPPPPQPAPQARVAPAPPPQQPPQARAAPPPQPQPQAAPSPSTEEQVAARQRGQPEADRGKGEKKDKERGGG